ncbi:MAG: DegT/DnrJ/EryC1/StrS family aminotransferase, partial [Odoribacter sp.]
GCMGNMGTTSFFPSKNLGGYGDGGAIFTNDDDLAQKAKMIANHGQRIKYHHDMIGCNSRLDTLQAAILNVKLRYLNDYKIARNSAADYYDRALNGIDGLILPHRKSNCTHVFHQYTIRVTNDRRDALKAFLQEEGIPSMIYYPIPLHQQKGYQKVNTASFPTAERLSREVLSIPIHTEMTKQQLEYITHTIRSFFETEFPNK